MPRPDPTFAWLLEHDPVASTRSRRDYATQVGILSPQDEADIAAIEVLYSDTTDGHHCKQCACRAEVRVNTVE